MINVKNEKRLQSRWWRGCRTHLLPQTHQKYIYMWKNSYWILTGDNRKTLVQPRWKERYRQNQVEREDKGSVPIGAESEEKGDYMGGLFPREWAVWATYWVSQPWSLTKGRGILLADQRASRTNRRVVENPHSAHEKWGNGCLLAKWGTNSRLKPRGWQTGFPG